MSRAIDTEFQELLEQARAGRVLLVAPDAPTRRRARDRVRDGKLVSPYPGMFADAAEWGGLDWRGRVALTLRTYARMRPDSVFCLFSAAFYWGLWVPRRDICRSIHVLGRGGRGHRHVSHHELSVTPADICVKGDACVTSLERTAFDCMRALDDRNALSVADSYLRISGLDPDSARELLSSRYVGHRGIRRVARIMAHADARSENGGESYARAVMIENNVMLPDLQVEVVRPDGSGRVYRLDYSWLLRDRTQVGGELDGFDKMLDPGMLDGRSAVEVMRAERMRESQLTALGIRVARFTFPMCVKVKPLLDVLDMFGIPRLPGATGW